MFCKDRRNVCRFTLVIFLLHFRGEMLGSIVLSSSLEEDSGAPKSGIGDPTESFFDGNSFRDFNFWLKTWDSHGQPG